MSENTSDKNLNRPGIDFIVTRVELDELNINQILKDFSSMGFFDINAYINSLVDGSLINHSNALKLLANLTNYHFDPDHRTEPFKPIFVWEDRRSLVPSDLQTEQVNIIAEFAPDVEHFGLRARLSDVSWFLQRRRQNLAEIAISAYCDAVEAVRDGRAKFSHKDMTAWGAGAKDYLARACYISYATQWKLPTSARVRCILSDLVAIAQQASNDKDFCRIASLDLDHAITLPEQIADMAEALATNGCLGQNPERRIRLWELAARAFQHASDNTNATRCMIEVAECHVSKADLANSSMLEAAFLQTAIQTLRNYPSTRQRREELADRLRKAQQYIGDEMGQFSTEIDLRDIVERAFDSVRGQSTPDAFLSLILCDFPPPPEDLRKIAIEHIQKFPLQGLMSAQVLDFQGRVVFNVPGIGDTAEIPEDHLRHAMTFHRGLSRQVTVNGTINPIRQTIAIEHLMRHEVIIELLRMSPFVPSGHEMIYARAISHFLSGEDIEAVSLLTPQLENSLRHILFISGYDTTTADSNGVQTEASLSILLKNDRQWRAQLEAIISTRYIQEIDLLFDFPGGPSVRNQVSHGKVPDSEFWAHDFTYAAWLIIHLALLPLARHRDQVEQIFSQVTGLHQRSRPHVAK